jgi:NAD(P)-dependent dehydrogenase (short-subunit alcohol dehydrogenase family)
MNKTVIVTGGTKGIGYEIAKYFYDMGWHVLVGARTKSDLNETLGERFKYLYCDVTHLSDHTKIINEAISWTGSVDVYVNNAGKSDWRQLDQIDETFWNDMMNVNAKSTLFGSQQAARVMKPGSSIINISSIAGKRGSSNNSVYCASKFAVNGITQSLAKELGPRGIRVNALCPVLVRTPGLIGALSSPMAPSKGKIEEFFEIFKNNNAALPELPTSKQVAEFCYFISQSTALTGQCINIDSGVFPQ